MKQLFRDREILSTLAVFTLVSVFIVGTFSFSTFPWFLFWPAFIGSSIFIVTNPRVGLFSIILLTMIWERFFTLQPLVLFERTIKLYPLDILLLVTGMSAIAHWLIERHHRKLVHDPYAHAPAMLRSFGACEKLLVVFALFATMYFFQSQVVGVHEPEVAFSTFKNYSFYILLTFLVLALVRTRDDFFRLIRTMLAGGVGIIAFIVLGFVRGEGLWTEFTPLSTEGVRYLAFPHAYYLMIVLLIAGNVWAHRLPGGAGSGSAGFHHPLRTLGIMGIQFIGILGSLMRHLWIAFIAGTVVMIATSSVIVKRQFLRWGQILFGVTLLLLLIGGTMIVVFPASAPGNVIAHFLDPLLVRITSLGHVTEDLSALWRLKLWQTAFTRFWENPLLGIGFGQEITFDVRGYISTVRVRDLHNSLFGLLVQMGVVGFALFVAIQTALIVGYLRCRKHLSSTIRPFVDGAFAAYVAFVVASDFQPYLETNILNIFFWLLLGIIRVAPHLSEKPNIDWSHLRLQKHLRILESMHRRGAMSP
ncbi:MAG: O-antigen ligase family protein [bacterium]|nr:O-antigen ligase family protein [bacterium]